MTTQAPIRQNLRSILDKLQTAYEGAPSAKRAKATPRLVAVSKIKPEEDIIEAYEAGHRHFGENYVQELVKKSNSPLILEKCPDIRWHFIGNCQTGKEKKLTGAKNLSCIETVDREKLAGNLQKQLAKKVPPEVVDVMVQVNTSGEANKNGVEPGAETLSLVKYIREECPNLKLVGLMTIGALAHSVPQDSSVVEPGSNPDFLTLIKCRKDVSEAIGIEDETSLELSMGMSNDFEEAIQMGSTNIRVGSSIFGARVYPPKNPPTAPAAPPTDVGEVSKALGETRIAA